MAISIRLDLIQLINTSGLCHPESKEKIIELRSLIKKVAPEAEELISYNMPSFNYYSRLLYYAAFKSHIGFYPMASGIAAFKSDISKFKWAKGSVQFPIDKPLPAH